MDQMLFQENYSLNQNHFQPMPFPRKITQNYIRKYSENTISPNNDKNNVENTQNRKLSCDPQDFKIKFKTEYCKFWKETGTCKFQEQCAFAHGPHELRCKTHLPQNYKTKKCKKFFEQGYCNYGERCQFLHNEDDQIPPPAQQMLQSNIPQQLSNFSNYQMMPNVNFSPNSSSNQGEILEMDDEQNYDMPKSHFAFQQQQQQQPQYPDFIWNNNNNNSYQQQSPVVEQDKPRKRLATFELITNKPTQNADDENQKEQEQNVDTQIIDQMISELDKQTLQDKEQEEDKNDIKDNSKQSSENNMMTPSTLPESYDELSA